MKTITDNPTHRVSQQETQGSPADLNTRPGFSLRGRRIHIHGVELGSDRSNLREAAGLGPLTGEAIYDPATGTFKQIDGSDVSNISNQAPNIAGPNQVPPAPG